MAFSCGTRLECCIVGSSASVAFTIKALVILNLAPHSFGFHSIHQKFELSLFCLVILLYVFYFINFSILVCITQFIMPKVYFCSKCDLQHLCPVGKKCKLEGESLASDVEVPAPPSPSPSGISTVSDQILSRLQELGDKMDSMDRRVQKAEAALGQGSSQASSALSSPHTTLTTAVFSRYCY